MITLTDPIVLRPNTKADEKTFLDALKKTGADAFGDTGILVLTSPDERIVCYPVVIYGVSK